MNHIRCGRESDTDVGVHGLMSVRILVLISGVAILGLLVLGAEQAAATKVKSVTASISPTTAGAPSTYTVGFEATTKIKGGTGTITLEAAGETGTTFPSVASDYLITDTTTSSGSGTVTVAPTLSDGSGTVKFIVPNGIAAKDNVTVTVSGVTNPPLASTTQTISVSTSTDTGEVASNAYSVTASSNGSGTMTVNPTTASPSTPTTLTFTFTAALGGMSSGELSLAVPSGWTAPSTTSGHAGYTSASTGTLAVSGQAITVSSVTLTSGSTLTVTYGAGGGSGAATPPSGYGTYAFTAEEESTSAGTLTDLASSPAVVVGGCPVAATDIWTGGAGTTNWTTGTNWSTGSPPTSTDFACLPAAAPGSTPISVPAQSIGALLSYKVLVLPGGISVTNSVDFEANATLEGGSVSGSNVIIGPASTVTVTGAVNVSGTASVTNEGTLQLSDNSSIGTLGACGATAPSFSNVGTMNFTASTTPAVFSWSCGFLNQPGAVVEKTGGAYSSSVEANQAQNQGSVISQNGVLTWASTSATPLVSTGSFTTTGQGVIQLGFPNGYFGQGANTFNSQTVIGNGIWVTGVLNGSVVVPAGVTLNAGETTYVDLGEAVVAASVSGSGTLDIDGSADLTGPVTGHPGGPGHLDLQQRLWPERSGHTRHRPDRAPCEPGLLHHHQPQRGREPHDHRTRKHGDGDGGCERFGNGVGDERGNVAAERTIPRLAPSEPVGRRLRRSLTWGR